MKRQNERSQNVTILKQQEEDGLVVLSGKDREAVEARKRQMKRQRQLRSKQEQELISTTISQLIQDPVEHDLYSLGDIMKKQGFSVTDSFNMELQNEIQRQVTEGKGKSGALVAPVTAVTKPKQQLQNVDVSSNSFVVLSPGVNGACNDRQLLKDMTFYFTGVFAEVNRTQKTAHTISIYD